MAKHNDFIFSSIEHVLEEGINALSSISDGIETYPLNEYIMKSVFENDRFSGTNLSA